MKIFQKICQNNAQLQKMEYALPKHVFHSIRRRRLSISWEVKSEALRLRIFRCFGDVLFWFSGRFLWFSEEVFFVKVTNSGNAASCSKLQRKFSTEDASFSCLITHLTMGTNCCEDVQMGSFNKNAWLTLKIPGSSMPGSVKWWATRVKLVLFERCVTSNFWQTLIVLLAKYTYTTIVEESLSPTSRSLGRPTWRKKEKLKWHAERSKRLKG